MASLTTTNTQPPAKRLKQSTIDALQEKPTRTIVIGTLVLPAGVESTCGFLTKIFHFLDIKSLCNVKESSLIQHLRKEFGCDDFERVRDKALEVGYKGRRSINEMRLSHPARRLYLLIERYQREFPHGTVVRRD